LAKSDQIKELTIEELFELKNKFLREIPHPKLIYKAIKSIELHANSPEYADLSVGSTLFETIEHYGAKVLNLKLKISQSKSSVELLTALKELNIEHMRLIKKLSEYVNDEDVAHFPDIKQSGAVDYYIIKKAQSNFPKQDNEIKEYLCKEFNAQNEGQDPNPILVPFIRAKKIVNHG